jgi:hypothetical protein
LSALPPSPRCGFAVAPCDRLTPEPQVRATTRLIHAPLTPHPPPSPRCPPPPIDHRCPGVPPPSLPPSPRRARPSRARAFRPHRCRAKREHFKGFRDFHLKAKARIWPWLSYMFHIRSTADPPRRACIMTERYYRDINTCALNINLESVRISGGPANVPPYVLPTVGATPAPPSAVE